MRRDPRLASNEKGETPTPFIHQELSHIPQRAGVYSIGIQLVEPIEVKVRGKKHILEAGTYVYTGSALGRSSNLYTRIRRHLSGEKKEHWHIDQITRVRQARTLFVVFSETSDREECTVNRAISDIAGSSISVAGFGASDCRSGCQAHLLLLQGEEIAEKIVKAYRTVDLAPKVLELRR